MIWLVEQGLHADNLRALAELADQRIPVLPAVYVTLGMIFRALANEYDDQAVETTRSNAVVDNLQNPLLDLLRAEDSSADLLLMRLNAVMSAFHALR